MFLGGIIFKEFLSTHEEWHASVIGLGDGYCPWEKRIKPNANTKRMVKKEYWYYSVGMAIGFALLIFSIAGAVALVLITVL